MRPAWLSGEAPGEEGDRGEHLRRQLVAVPIMKVGVAVVVRAECVKAEVSEFSAPWFDHLKDGPEFSCGQ